MNRKYAKEYEIDPKLPKTGNKKGYRYIGEYYRYAYHTTKKRMMTEYSILTAILTASWLAAGLVNNPSSRFAPVGILYAIGLFPVFYLIYGLIETYRISQTDMEHCQYDMSYLRVGKSITGIMILAGFILAADVIFMILERENMNWGKEILFFFLMILAEDAVFLLKRTLKKNPCTVIKH